MKLKFIAIFFLIVAIFFYPTILKGKLPVPSDSLVGLYHPFRDLLSKEFPRGIPFKNFLITDPIRQQIPWRKIAIDQWKDANLPRWNPFAFSGMPLAANIQSGTFYPLNILFFLLPFPVAWTALIVLQPLLAGLFLYLFLRHLTLNHWASLLGSIVWSFGGFGIAWLSWGTMMHVALWLPLILLAIDKKWPYVLVFSLASSIFAGHIQIALYITILAAAYALWRKTDFRILSWIGVAAGLVTIILWLPFIELVSQSGRITELDTWTKPGWFLPWQHLAQFIAPDFFGNPTTLNYWGEWNYGEFIGYAGIVSLIFVIHAFSVHVGRFWKFTLLTSLLFMLPNLVSKVPYQLHFPILATLQPTRLMVLVSFSMAVLCAYGFDSFLKKFKKPLFAIFTIGLGLVILWIVVLFLPGANAAVAKRNLILPTALFLSGSVLLYFPKKIFTFAAVALIAFDLLRFGWKFTPFTDAKYFFPNTAAIEFLKSQEKPFRIASTDAKILPPNVSAYYGIESIEGYDPIYLRSYEEFIAASERGKADINPPYGFNRIIIPHNLDSPLLPLLSVRYVLALGEINNQLFKKVFQEGETRIYEDSRFVERAYFVDGVTIEKNRQSILENLFSKDFRAKETAYVEKDVSLLSVPVNITEYVTIRKYNSGSIELEVEAQNMRFLVISNMFYPGWVAEIDGKPTEIYRTNYLFQGIVIPPGRHILVVRYQG